MCVSLTSLLPYKYLESKHYYVGAKRDLAFIQRYISQSSGCLFGMSNYYSEMRGKTYKLLSQVIALLAAKMKLIQWTCVHYRLHRPFPYRNQVKTQGCA